MGTFRGEFLAGCCGLYCGLCPKYQSQAGSRCLGCHLGEARKYCGVYRCCVAERGLHTCSDCDECPCEKLLRVLRVREGLDSFLSHRPALPNLDRIRDSGMRAHLAEQEERRSLLERLLFGYNDGRSMSFYCRVCALMRPERVRQAIDEAQVRVEARQVDRSDRKRKAKAMGAILQAFAREDRVDLDLRRKPPEG